jgi:hypothetical protein
MASGKNDARQAIKEEVARLEKEVYGESFNVDFEQMRLLTRAQREFTLKFLDKVINSRWTRSDKKDYFKLFRAIVVEDGKNKDNIINLLEIVNSHRMVLLLLNKEISATKNVAKDVDGLKSKIDEILNSPAMREIGKILENMQKLAQQKELNTPKKSSNKDYVW